MPSTHSQRLNIVFECLHEDCKGGQGLEDNCRLCEIPECWSRYPPLHGGSKGLCHGDESEAAEIIVPLFVFPFH